MISSHDDAPIRLITRADDAGVADAHDRAILDCARNGIVRNVSLMACGPAIRRTANLMSGESSICFGMHAALHSEWDSFRWGPVSSRQQVPSLVDEHGFFHPSPAYYLDHPPDLDEIMAELRSQLNLLRKLGFDVRYADTHMMFEWAISDMDERFDRWCEEEGLISHRPFYSELPQTDEAGDPVEQFAARLRDAGPGQYVMIGHPGMDDEETRNWGNEHYPGRQVAMDRHWDRLIYTDDRVRSCVNERGIALLRYDEAEPHLTGESTR